MRNKINKQIIFTIKLTIYYEVFFHIRLFYIIVAKTPNVICFSNITFHCDRYNFMISLFWLRESIIGCNLNIDCCDIDCASIEFYIARIIVIDKSRNILRVSIDCFTRDSFVCCYIFVGCSHRFESLTSICYADRSSVKSFPICF